MSVQFFFVPLQEKININNGNNMDKKNFYIRQSSASFDKIMAEIKKRGGIVSNNEKPITFDTVNGVPCWGINIFGKVCYASEGTFIKHGYQEILIGEE